MKTWQHVLLGFLLGIVSVGVILLTVTPPRGLSVELLPAPTPQPATIYITGCVEKPGLYQLSPDSRVVDALELAGGDCQSSNLAGINLAAKLSDGMQIDVPFEGNQSSTHPVINEKSSDNENLQIQEASININTASWEIIETLPGIGPEKAKQIVEYRQEVGFFLTIDDLLKVPGIGATILSQIEPYITLK